jgi:hypothetical protein
VYRVVDSKLTAAALEFNDIEPYRYLRGIESFLTHLTNLKVLCLSRFAFFFPNIARSHFRFQIFCCFDARFTAESSEPSGTTHSDHTRGVVRVESVASSHETRFSGFLAHYTAPFLHVFTSPKSYPYTGNSSDTFENPVG